MELGAGGRTIARGHESGSLNIPPPREQERKLEQEKLSGVVKSVHRRLRKKYREGKQGAGWGGRGGIIASAPCLLSAPAKVPPLQPKGAARQPLPVQLSQARTLYGRASVRVWRAPPAPFSTKALQKSSRPVEKLESPTPPISSRSAEIIVTTHKNIPLQRRWRFLVARDGR